ncbi:pseudoazurin [Lutibaculum baratangense]|uniref:Pseudoazurin n=1 Tax=Lutibaculum baratangense AMV1 TaxID=631454 RepID=V4RLR3_9HYPH|nr:pseudoazurin [Lutibaculum baratangense]ESR26259.1 Pseudoazurin precursor [Lutibaculum baratangense AMV1]
MIRQIAAAAAFALALAAAQGAAAAEHEVRMLNKAERGVMVFEPPFLRVAPGDTVKFIASDKGHNAESIPGMVPEGGQTWKGKINEEVDVTFETPGIYGYKCLPHYAMGMVGVIQVGDDSSNLSEAAAVKHPGKAKAAFADALARAGN